MNWTIEKLVNSSKNYHVVLMHIVRKFMIVCTGNHDYMDICFPAYDCYLFQESVTWSAPVTRYGTVVLWWHFCGCRCLSGRSWRTGTSTPVKPADVCTECSDKSSLSISQQLMALFSTLDVKKYADVV